MAGARLGTHPPIAGEKDGVAFDVAVDDALVVQVGQSSQDGQADGGDLLLVHPETVKGKNELSVNEDGGKGDKEGQGTSPWSHQSVDGRRCFRQWFCGHFGPVSVKKKGRARNKSATRSG